MPQQVRVEYRRTVTGTDYSSATAGASYEFTISDSDDWAAAWHMGFQEVKATVDSVFGTQPTPAPAAPPPPETPPAVAPPPAGDGLLLRDLAASSTPVRYNGVRLVKPVVARSGARNADWLRCELEGAGIFPEGIVKANAKSFDQGPITAVRQGLSEGMVVNVAGKWEPWRNNPEKFDLVIEFIEAAR